MVLIKQCGRLLIRDNVRRTCSVWTRTGRKQPARWRTDSAATKVITSQLSDIEIPSGLIYENLWRNLERWPDRDALVCGVTNRKYTYFQLRSACKRFAASLKKRGIDEGQVIAVLLPNIPEFAVCVLGCNEAGIVVTTMNPLYTAYEIAHQLKDSGACGVVTIDDLLPRVVDAEKMVAATDKKSFFNISINLNGFKSVGAWDFFEMIDPSVDTSQFKSATGHNSNLAFMPYSSGTTGLSKGVELSNKNINANLAQMTVPDIQHVYDTTPDYQDVLPAILPFYHIYGLTVLLCNGLFHGNKLISLPKLESERFLSILKDQKATVLYAVPPLILLLGQNKSVNSSHFETLKIICNGAGPVKEADGEKILDKAKNKELRFLQAYGMTETSPVVFVPKNCDRNSYLTVGSPVSNTQARVVDPDDSSKLYGPGEVGEIQVRGPQVMLGYHNNPKATASTIDSEGWLSTGDIGYYDENDKFYISDRLKELIKVQGYQVPPAELEGLLRTHPKILDAAVVGVSHPRTGEAPLAFVVVDPDEPTPSAEDIQSFISTRVSPYKQITGGIQFVESLPKSAAGKILRRLLKDEYMKKHKIA